MKYYKEEKGDRLMKMTTLTNLMFLTSLTVFTACSTNSPKPAKLTTLEILGIDTHPSVHHNVVVRNDISTLPMARTYPVVEPIARTYPMTQPMARTYPMEQPMARTYPVEQPMMARTYPISYHPEPRRTNPYIQNYLTVANEVESNAKRLLGIKYVWGATGPYTYDCSGFTQKVYRDAGINIPRVSRDQARVGQYIPFNALRRGDMVFFDTHKRRSGQVTHVGIYLGNNNFIHASSAAKKVVIFNFDEKPYYKKRFLWGRRVIRDNVYMASL